jgi:hypothetical protein
MNADDLEFDLSGPVSEMFEIILLEAADAPGPPSKVEAPMKQAVKEVRAAYPNLSDRTPDLALGRALGRIGERATWKAVA